MSVRDFTGLLLTNNRTSEGSKKALGITLTNCSVWRLTETSPQKYYFYAHLRSVCLNSCVFFKGVCRLILVKINQDLLFRLL